MKDSITLLPPMVATSCSVSLRKRKSEELKVMRKRLESLERMGNSLRDALRWTTATLVVVQTEMAKERVTGLTPHIVAHAITTGKSALQRISSHRINHQPTRP